MSPSTPPTLARLSLGALTFNSANLDDLLNIIKTHSKEQQSKTTGNALSASASSGLCIGYVNPHVFNLSQTDATVTEFLQQCDLVCLDGLGVCLAIRTKLGWFSKTPVHRVVALNLFDALISTHPVQSTAVILGIDPEDIEKTAQNINDSGSSFSIVASTDGFQHLATYESFLLDNSHINWVFIGAGTPKSESIALMARKVCPEANIFHAGAGTFKVYAGTKHRAPNWVSRFGCEWLHRIFFEPHTRERYTKGGWLFLKNLIKPTSNKPTETT